MKRNYKTITPEMIRKYFGQNARITRRIAGGWRVRTAKGGEVVISQSNIDPIYGGSAVYRAAVLLSDEAWGGGRVKGAADFKLAVMAHGEAEGVDVRVKERGLIARTIVAALIGFVGIDLSSPGVWGLVWVFVALAVWLLMGRAAKRRAQRETDQMSNRYPRTGGDAHEANDEDLKKGDWT